MKKILLSAILGVFVTTGAMADLGKGAGYPGGVWGNQSWLADDAYSKGVRIDVDFFGIPIGTEFIGEMDVYLENDQEYLDYSRKKEFCEKENTRWKNDSEEQCLRRIEMLDILTDDELKDTEICHNHLISLYFVTPCFYNVKGMNLEDYNEAEAERLKEAEAGAIAMKEAEAEAEEARLEAEADAICEGKKASKKCAKKEKIAQNINSKYGSILSLPILKKECGELIGSNSMMLETTIGLKDFSVKKINKCKRAAKKMSKLVKKAEKVNSNTKFCLEFTDFKAIKNCITKGKIAKKLDEKYVGVNLKPAVKKECPFLIKTEEDIYSDKYSVKDAKRCRKAAKKMTRYIKKSNKKYGGKCLEEKSLELVKSCMTKLEKSEKILKKKEKYQRKINNLSK